MISDILITEMFPQSTFSLTAFPLNTTAISFIWFLLIFAVVYGDFDSLCLRTLRELKKEFQDIELIFITPYIDQNYSKLEFAKYHYDDVIFPPLECVPRKFAILKRNEWMVEEADLVIAYVMYSWGGAAKTLEYAKRKKVPIINIALN